MELFESLPCEFLPFAGWDGVLTYFKSPFSCSASFPEKQEKSIVLLFPSLCLCCFSKSIFLRSIPSFNRASERGQCPAFSVSSARLLVMFLLASRPAPGMIWCFWAEKLTVFQRVEECEWQKSASALSLLCLRAELQMEKVHAGFRLLLFSALYHLLEFLDLECCDLIWILDAEKFSFLHVGLADRQSQVVTENAVRSKITCCTYKLW